jgi:hypothetical protein
MVVAADCRVINNGAPTAVSGTVRISDFWDNLYEKLYVITKAQQRQPTQAALAANTNMDPYVSRWAGTLLSAATLANLATLHPTRTWGEVVPSIIFNLARYRRRLLTLTERLLAKPFPIEFKNFILDWSTLRYHGEGGALYAFIDPVQCCAGAALVDLRDVLANDGVNDDLDDVIEGLEARAQSLSGMTDATTIEEMFSIMYGDSPMQFKGVPPKQDGSFLALWHNRCISVMDVTDTDWGAYPVITDLDDALRYRTYGMPPHPYAFTLLRPNAFIDDITWTDAGDPDFYKYGFFIVGSVDAQSGATPHVGYDIMGGVLGYRRNNTSGVGDDRLDQGINLDSLTSKTLIVQNNARLKDAWWQMEAMHTAELGTRQVFHPVTGYGQAYRAEAREFLLETERVLCKWFRVPGP